MDLERRIGRGGWWGWRCGRGHPLLLGQTSARRKDDGSRGGHEAALGDDGHFCLHCSGWWC